MSSVGTHKGRSLPTMKGRQRNWVTLLSPSKLYALSYCWNGWRTADVSSIRLQLIIVVGGAATQCIPGMCALNHHQAANMPAMGMLLKDYADAYLNN